MNLKDKKGSISIFVLVALLFMASVLLLMFASSINKSKVVKEQFNTISGIYTYDDVDAYNKAYTDLRESTKDNQIVITEEQSVLNLTKTYGYNLINFKIYGNTLSDGTSVGDSGVEGESNLIPLKITGKNLLNPNTVQESNVYINCNYGNENTPSATGGIWRASNYIYISAGKTYHLNAINNNASVAGIAWYDVNKTYISGVNTKMINQNNGNITAPDNARYLRISWRIDEGYNPNWRGTVQLEEGTSGTKFEEYREQTVNISLTETLRKIGDIADYIDYTNGKIFRKIGVIESYNGETISTEYISNTGDLSIGATVYYQLPEESQYVEEISLSELKTFEDYTIINVLTSVPPSKMEVEYVGYTLGQEETEEVQ